MVSHAPNKTRPTLAISMGDPGGIGPEVLVAALTDPDVRACARFIVHGVGSAMHAAADALGVDPFWWSVQRGSALIDAVSMHDVVLVDANQPGAEETFARAPSKRGGQLSFQFVEDAISQVREGPLRADAMVTGPISKEAWGLAGRRRFPGHTELLASRFGAKRHGMMFVATELRVILATSHVPLMEVRDVLTIGRVFDAIDLGHDACRQLGIGKPRIAVCGLNPHAGEGGLLGDEEERLIVPAIEAARSHGIDASGPFPGDTIFREAIPRPGSGKRARYDLVVAMYHDQGLIPLKLLFRDDAVNVTVGLPGVRTSPDHGTAFDIAGKGVADPGSMRAAVFLAARMACAPARETPDPA